jgi:hypothetical protein
MLRVARKSAQTSWTAAKTADLIARNWCPPFARPKSLAAPLPAIYEMTSGLERFILVL